MDACRMKSLPLWGSPTDPAMRRINQMTRRFAVTPCGHVKARRAGASGKGSPRGWEMAQLGLVGGAGPRSFCPSGSSEMAWSVWWWAMWPGQAAAGSPHRGHEDTMEGSGGGDGRMPMRRLGGGLPSEKS
jgi:hypothetical protein